MGIDWQNLPEDSEVAREVIQSHKEERGMLGKIFGSREHAPTNIAGLVVLASLVGVLLAASGVGPLAGERAFTAFSSILTLALGYLFGRGFGGA